MRFLGLGSGSWTWIWLCCATAQLIMLYYYNSPPRRKSRFPFQNLPRERVLAKTRFPTVRNLRFPPKPIPGSEFAEDPGKSDLQLILNGMAIQKSGNLRFPPTESALNPRPPKSRFLISQKIDFTSIFDFLSKIGLKIIY